jgi:hypothetical protein
MYCVFSCVQVTLPCSASGVPTPTIEWRRADGHPLPKESTHQKNVPTPFYILLSAHFLNNVPSPFNLFCTYSLEKVISKNVTGIHTFSTFTHVCQTCIAYTFLLVHF